MEQTTKSRALGAMWGTCVADALGGPAQFKEPNTFPPVTGLAYIPQYRKPAGSFSDDGSMTLALAQAFIESEGKYNHALSIQNWVEWWADGRFSTYKSSWDVGGSTRRSLSIWRRQGVDDLENTQHMVRQKLDKDEFSGNGSLMRVSPIGVMLWKDPDAARKISREQSLPIHPSLACVDGCEAFTLLICQAMCGATKEKLCETICNFTFTHPAFVERFAQYKTMDDWTVKSASDIQSSGWVVDTLEAALWAFFKYHSWSDSVLAVVNLGGDADTAGAVCGGLSGVFYSFEAIPSEWRNGMVKMEMIDSIADRFASLVTP